MTAGVRAHAGIEVGLRLCDDRGQVAGEYLELLNRLRWPDRPYTGAPFVCTGSGNFARMGHVRCTSPAHAHPEPAFVPPLVGGLAAPVPRCQCGHRAELHTSTTIDGIFRACMVLGCTSCTGYRAELVARYLGVGSALFPPSEAEIATVDQADDELRAATRALAETVGLDRARELIAGELYDDWGTHERAAADWAKVQREREEAPPATPAELCECGHPRADHWAPTTLPILSGPPAVGLSECAACGCPGYRQASVIDSQQLDCKCGHPHTDHAKGWAQDADKCDAPHLGPCLAPGGCACRGYRADYSFPDSTSRLL